MVNGAQRLPTMIFDAGRAVSEQTHDMATTGDRQYPAIDNQERDDVGVILEKLLVVWEYGSFQRQEWTIE